jgi:ABC-type multidrug transport system ATPase subunit
MPSQLTLTLPPNVLHTQSQQLTIEKVATLIGGNGSGKSCILHSIFDQKITKKDYKELRLVSFTSGQNENFTARFATYLKTHLSSDNDLNLDIFHFDKTWAKLLIFLATATRRNGHVRKFLKEEGYVHENTDRDDITTKFHFKFKIESVYAERIKKAVEDEASGEITETIRTTAFHLALENFIENCVKKGYEFEGSLPSMDVTLNASQLERVSFPLKKNEDRKTVPQNPTLNFFIKAAGNGYFIDASNSQLQLTNDQEQELELDLLSDGEYQLLFLYALLDLLDSEQTLFLLDEADSHLHYANINAMWTLLKQIKGHAITTTHLLDSITSNEHSSLHVIEKGRIAAGNKLKTLIERLRVLSKAKYVEYEICAQLPHLALMDHYNDWEIFIRLAEKKELDVSLIKSVCAFSKESSYGSLDEELGTRKFDWLQGFRKEEENPRTSHVFLICDRDEAAITWKSNGVEVAGKKYSTKINQIKWPQRVRVDVSLLAWKRREIKNYLLSHTALSHHNALDTINNGSIGADDHLKANEPGDNDGIRRLRAKDAVDPLINGTDGLCSQKLQDYIDLIPPSEISEDIEKMFHFIKAKLS